ncbi:MAG: hypothetical protein J3K34DRAFT_476206 [Monoraphidium minutum]|nr:MAG: hypothetical protein J3K34DRAFT_476206 [Monoraphidium minutum]
MPPALGAAASHAHATPSASGTSAGSGGSGSGGGSGARASIHGAAGSQRAGASSAGAPGAAAAHAAAAHAAAAHAAAAAAAAPHELWELASAAAASADAADAAAAADGARPRRPRRGGGERLTERQRVEELERELVGVRATAGAAWRRNSTLREREAALTELTLLLEHAAAAADAKAVSAPEALLEACTGAAPGGLWPSASGGGAEGGGGKGGAPAGGRRQPARRASRASSLPLGGGGDGGEPGAAALPAPLAALRPGGRAAEVFARVARDKELRAHVRGRSSEEYLAQLQGRVMEYALYLGRCHDDAETMRRLRAAVEGHLLDEVATAVLSPAAAADTQLRRIDTGTREAPPPGHWASAAARVRPPLSGAAERRLVYGTREFMRAMKALDKERAAALASQGAAPPWELDKAVQQLLSRYRAALTGQQLLLLFTDAPAETWASMYVASYPYAPAAHPELVTEMLRRILLSPAAQDIAT